MKLCRFSVVCVLSVIPCLAMRAAAEEDFPKPYSAPCVERENVFEFAEKPAIKTVGPDKYEITFAVKGNCDATVAIVDETGTVVRHVASGVLGANAPAPFQKNSLKQTLEWNGKDDLEDYVKRADMMKVRVSLGLKPEFDKLLGGSSPKNLPGYVFGMAISQEGVFVVYKGGGSHGHAGVRKFDHDGNYVAALVPPPANMPQEKLGGMGYVEYEKGKFGLQAPNVNEMARDAYVLPGVNGKTCADQQPVIIGSRLYFVESGTHGSASAAHYINTDGSTTLEGMSGYDFFAKPQPHTQARLAASPDGKWIYMTRLGSTMMGGESGSVVVRWPADGKEKAATFVNKSGKPGSDNDSLNQSMGIDVDAQGRVYVSDGFNSRVQIFSPDGKYLKTIAADRPTLVRVHQKTGAIYLLHAGRVEGKSVGRLTKFASFDSPKEVFHVDDFVATSFALDSWTAKPRLWLAGAVVSLSTAGADGSGPGIRIYEEDGNQLKKIADFDSDAKKDGGASFIGKFSAALVGPGGKITCDPTRETVLFNNHQLFDLKTGELLGSVKIPAFAYDDMAYDKRGYLHVHLNPGFDSGPGVLRVDPARVSVSSGKDGQKVLYYPEVPYDYGVEAPPKYSDPRKGILPCKDQPGAKYFQDGIGVNMMGDVAENCNVYYAPKMEDEGAKLADAGIAEMKDRNEYVGAGEGSYADFMKMMKEREKQGEVIYFIPRRPGIPLVGATIWTYKRNGELKEEAAVIAAKHIAGVGIDEKWKLYFATSMPKMFGKRHFLAGQGGTFGKKLDQGNANPFTGTMIKGGENGVMFLKKRAPVPTDQMPDRGPDLMGLGFPNAFSEADWTWVENAEWLYAGASPIQYTGCTCPTSRFHLDWFRRTYVPEVYRHSIGVLDANGNLILHIGQYGNFDSWQGPKSKIRVGGDEIGILVPRFISGTDNYLCFHDWGERMAVLKLNYHTEESVPVGK
ncbi:MAG: hypothetical protein C0404_11150 [Verrucomicrobia bacterium]|nr:hypothetical protein [Verrucomicrobiota bacterium]